MQRVMLDTVYSYSFLSDCSYGLVSSGKEMRNQQRTYLRRWRNFWLIITQLSF